MSNLYFFYAERALVCLHMVGHKLFLKRALVDTIGTRIREHEGHIFILDLCADRVVRHENPYEGKGVGRS